MAGVGFAPWDNLKEVTVSPMTLCSDKSVSVFNTRATHHVFKNWSRFITIQSTDEIPVKMANGSRGGVIVGVGTVEIEGGGGGGEQDLLRQVYLCETLKHSLVLGLQFMTMVCNLERICFNNLRSQ